MKDDISGDFSVCKSDKGKTIEISNYGYDPDMTIQVSSYVSDFDFTIYNNSILSIEEAISILVIPTFSILDKKTSK